MGIRVKMVSRLTSFYRKNNDPFVAQQDWQRPINGSVVIKLI